MSKRHETIRVIDGKNYRATDVGAEDFDRAEYNRYIVENQLFTTFYQQMASWFAHTPLGSPLPVWMPIGEIPQAGGKNRGDYSGDGDE